MSEPEDEFTHQPVDRRDAQNRHSPHHRRSAGRRAGIAGSTDHEHGAQSWRNSSAATCATTTACPSNASSPTRTIGGVAEAAQTAEKFRREGVGVRITVTPCWCYGSETMDMDPLIPKAVWGFNGTERPGAVYLAAVSAAHNQKGLPVFNIYGREVQDAGDTSIPEDVQEKLLRLCPRRPGRGEHARQVAICPWAASRWASAARLSTIPF